MEFYSSLHNSLQKQHTQLKRNCCSFDEKNLEKFLGTADMMTAMLGQDPLWPVHLWAPLLPLTLLSGELESNAIFSSKDFETINWSNYLFYCKNKHGYIDNVST